MQQAYAARLQACNEAVEKAKAETVLFEKECAIENRRLRDTLHGMRENLSRTSDYLQRLDGKLPAWPQEDTEPETVAEPEVPPTSSASEAGQSGLGKVMEGIDRVMHFDLGTLFRRGGRE